MNESGHNTPILGAKEQMGMYKPSNQSTKYFILNPSNTGLGF